MELLVYSKDRSDLRTNGGSGQGVQLFYMEQLECVKRKKEYLEVCIGSCHYRYWYYTFH